MPDRTQKEKHWGGHGKGECSSAIHEGWRAILVVVLSFLIWCLRGTAGVSCFWAWMCAAFSSYWAVHRLGGIFSYLEVDADYVLWGGIAGGLILQLVCYICFRCCVRILWRYVLLLTGKGSRTISTMAGSLSLLIKVMCGLALLMWPLLALIWTYRLAEEMNRSTGRLMGLLEESLKIWSLPVFVLAVLCLNYVILDFLCIRVWTKDWRKYKGDE